jgi:hypothetical protein
MRPSARGGLRAVVGLLRTPGLLDALRNRARDGCRVRVLTYTPGRELGPLIGDDQIEPYVFEASPGHALIRVGDQMLVTLSFPGATDQPPPLLQLHRQTDGGLFDSLTDHFQLLAEHAEPITLRQPLDASPTGDKDRDERQDTNHHAPAVEPPKQAGDRGSLTSEPHTPRPWPRQAS